MRFTFVAFSDTMETPFSTTGQNDLFDRFYRDQDDYQLLITWVNSYFELYGVCQGQDDIWNRDWFILRSDRWPLVVGGFDTSAFQVIPKHWTMPG